MFDLKQKNNKKINKIFVCLQKLSSLSSGFHQENLKLSRSMKRYEKHAKRFLGFQVSNTKTHPSKAAGADHRKCAILILRRNLFGFFSNPSSDLTGTIRHNLNIGGNVD